MINQAKFIADYNERNRPKFNDKFFQKSDDDIIEDLKDVILSCQRDKFYTIRVEKFEVIDDYAEIQRLLTGEETPTISIKDSDLKILKVTYYTAIGNQEDTFDVLIAVPRVIDGAYIHLNGNDYFPLFQLVDGSTYNNTSSVSAKTQSITLKTNSNAVKMLRNFFEFKLSDGETFKKLASFSVYLFDHKVTLFEYYLARFGWYKTISEFKFDHVIKVTEEDPQDDEYDTFVVQNSHMKTPIYISAVRSVLDADRILQSFVAAFIISINKYATKKFTLDNIYNTDFWICKLGFNFVSSETSVFTKGNAIIESLENSYDIPTQKRLRLPDEIKSNIYSVLKWMASEFSYIRLKDNLDASSKRIRWSEYIAAMYIMIINLKLRRLPEKPDPNVEVLRIKQQLNTPPMALIAELQKSNLKGFRNMVNDRDSFLQLKYTIKGPSGPGEGNGKKVAQNIRAVDISQLGIIDVNTSSASDPGVGGMLCPLNDKVFEYNSFTNEPEPNTWDANFDELLKIYRDQKGYTSAIALAEDAGLELTDDRNPESVAFDTEYLGNLIGKIAPTKAFETQLRPAFINMEDSGSIIFED